MLVAIANSGVSDIVTFQYQRSAPPNPQSLQQAL